MIGISEELKNTDPDLLSPLTLAFVGDTVFDLLVRGNLVMQANRPVGKLHPLAATQVYTHITYSELKRNYKHAHPRALKKGG